MPPVSRTTSLSPQELFGVLSQPPAYAHWVVGSRSVDRHEAGWPAPGTRFEHTQGVWPLLLHDETEVVASDAPRRLELIVKARPLLVARVVLELRPDGTGTLVAMDEQPISGLLAPLLRLPPGAVLTRLRNRLSLRRLAKFAER